jgi:Skp family chaperone for outer membrane proteins
MGITLAVGLLGVTGCQRDGAGPAGRASAEALKTGGVAVIDLDEVAKRMGRDKEIGQSVEMQEATLSEKLAGIHDSLNKQYASRKETLGEKPTTEQQQELKSLEKRLSLRVRREQAQAQSDLAVYQQGLIARFREEVKPVARKVAAAKGLSIVLTKDEGLFLAVEPAVEITDDVIAKLLENQATLPPRMSEAPAKKKAKQKSAN